jgi:diguanylate cyclase (GGDEF)-like protein
MNNILSIINKELVSGVESKFLTKQVVPDVVGNLGRYSILVSPLYYGNNKQGYYVSTLCAECLNFYKSIQSLLGSMLYSEVVVERAHLIDPLTKLSNRMFFNMRVESLTASKSKKIALMYIDIDQFKKINTRLGHESGDVVLREVANKLKSTYVNSEDIFRLGSDEFLILVSDYKSNKDVMRLAKKIVSDITREFFVSKYEVKLEVNVGISVYPDDGSTPTELLQAADSALVMSKNYGANQYSFYDPLMSEEQNTRIEVENTILDSFDNDNFFIQFQPRVNCQSGLITYFEALVRIKKDGRVLYPDEFLQVAEEMNVISEIDEWVLENACKEINEWNRKGDMGSHISLNMSSRELNDMEIVGKYLKIISRHHLSPSQFSLEVTNKVISDDEHLTIAVLNKFRENGFKVVMDIDGFSFAEMDKIRHFPIDTIKIQKKIIDDLGQNKVSQIIIQSVVLIAKELGYKVVAEGVEDGKQYEFLREVGCDEVQGYYFSKPKYADELVEYRKSSYRFIN